MYLKRVIIFVLISTFLSAASVAGGGPELRTIELRYRCVLETSNPVWHLLFFLFSSDNREFLWREKNGQDDAGSFLDIEVFNQSRKVAKYYTRNGISEAQIDFGSSDNSGTLNPDQARINFEILKFIRSAQNGDKAETDYDTKKSRYHIWISAREAVLFFSDKGNFSTTRFEIEVTERSGRFAHIELWIINDGDLRGQVFKCSLKKSFWPAVTVELM